MNALKVILAVLEKLLGLIQVYLAGKAGEPKHVKDAWPKEESKDAREKAREEARKHFDE